MNFTLLEQEQIFGKNRLDIFKKYGVTASITDFAILLGGYVTAGFRTGGNDLKHRNGWYWSKDPYGHNASIISYDGFDDWYIVARRVGGCRPASPFSSIQEISSIETRGKNGLIEIEYGEYPQWTCTKNIQNILDSAYKKGSLNKTGKSYTVDSRKYDEYNEDFLAKEYEEYEYNGKKYVRVISNTYFDGRKVAFSTGEQYKNGDSVWVEVSPVRWLVDEKSKIMVAKHILFAGIQFNKEQNYQGDFDNTTLGKYLKEVFSKDILPSNILNKEEFPQNIRNINPYGFDFDKVSEENIIRGAVESNVAVFLHGKSSEGKSARVKQLDPDCEVIYLLNASPDSLSGKSVYEQPIVKNVINKETGVEETIVVREGRMLDVPPAWFVKVQEKCKKEPDKIHIVFFDELTNALPSIQSMAYNIILDKEVNGKWKLPDNCRVVAAGNEMEDSLAANEMVEPLFNRFAHVYINTTVEDWLKWAVTPESEYQRLDYVSGEKQLKIHPSIIAYISSRKEMALRTEYNGVKPNADPRKWEMASKVLYKTNNPNMLRSLIGEELTADFIAFCKQSMISVEDIINGNYSEEDINVSLDKRLTMASTLSSVSEEHIEVVRDFVKKLGKEPLGLFDNLWVHGDIRRLEKIQEFEMINENRGVKK